MTSGLTPILIEGGGVFMLIVNEARLGRYEREVGPGSAQAFAGSVGGLKHLGAFVHTGSR